MTEPDTQRTFGSRFAMTGGVVSTPLYEEHDARDLESAVEVGLMVPRAALFATPVARSRLARGVAESRAVLHPRVRRVFAFGDAPAPWIGYQPARPLIADGRLSRDQLVIWIDAIAGALLALHSVGLVHGGVLEPDLVRVDGELRVGGGGIWACADPTALAAAAGDAPLAPERRHGRPATAAADAWSLAAVIARWAGGATDAKAPDVQGTLLALDRRHPALAAVLRPMLADDPTVRRHDLVGFAAAARTALAEPFADEAPRPRGRRRNKVTTEEHTPIGRAGAGSAGAPVPVPVPVPDQGQAQGQASSDHRSAPMLAVSMKPGGPKSRGFDQPTPPAPTPQIHRAIIRETTRDDATASLGRLAPPRAVVEAERREARRPWILGVVGLLVLVVVVLAVLVLR